jgi:steroid delta-isomerase-like uncharacterized protein
MSTTDTALALSLAIQNGELLARADELLADDFHYTGAAGMVLDKAGYVGFMHGLSESFSDQAMTFHATVADNDKVAVAWTNDMTHMAAYQGVPATGNRITASGNWIRQIRDGKVVREWDTTDIFGLMNQLGAFDQH